MLVCVRLRRHQRGGFDRRAVRCLPHSALEPLQQKFGPAFRGSQRTAVDRERFQVVGLFDGPRVIGALDRIIVERRDLRGVHARRCEPLRDVNIAEPFNIHQRLASAGAGRGARGCKRISDQHDPRLTIAFADVKIDRPDFDKAIDFERPRQFLQLWDHRPHGLLWRVAKLRQPRIAHIAIDEQIGTRRSANREQGEVRHPRRRVLREVSESREIERSRARWLQIETD